MKAGSNRDGIIIFVFIIPRSFEQFAEGQDGPRGLVLSFIDSFMGKSCLRVISGLVPFEEKNEPAIPPHSGLAPVPDDTG